MKQKVGVIIPVYNCKDQVHLVFETFPFSLVHLILIVDDCCPTGSGDAAKAMAEQHNNSSFCKVELIKNEKNAGVGGAVKAGINHILKHHEEIEYLIKIDGDGQMDPLEIHSFIEAAETQNADYVKGNRFTDISLLHRMPKIRLIGNSLLSFIMKVATGNYTIMDPTTGFLLMHRRIFETINLDKIHNRFFFESSLLGEVTLRKLSVTQVPVKTIYGQEESNLSVRKVLLEFPPKITRIFLKRMLYQYFLYNFTFGSIALIIGIPLFIFSVLFGGYHWIMSFVNDVPATAGTVMLSGLSFLISIQCAILFFSEDIKAKKPV